MRRPQRTCRLRSTSGLDTGIHQLAQVVKVTYGPKGGTVALQRAAGPLWTRDGATVAWELHPANPSVRMGVRIAQSACDKVSKAVGDGTTTTAILLSALLRQVRKEIAGGADPWMVAQRLRGHAWRTLLQTWHCEATDDWLRAVALSAAHGDKQIAEALIEAQELVGSQGLLVVEEGKSRKVEVLQKPGFVLDWGAESLEMAATDGGPRELDAPLVALLDVELTKLEHVAPILEEATAFPHPLLIVSRGIYGQALQTILANDRKLERQAGPVLEVGATRTPLRGRHAWFRDLAALTGATVVPSQGKFDPAWFGGLRKVVLQREKSVLTAADDAMERLETHLACLAEEERVAESTWEAEECRRRAAMLSGGLCVLRVGGDSPTEIKERKARVEDAIRAVQATVRGGLLPAGIWMKLAEIEPAFWAPLERVLENAGVFRSKCQFLTRGLWEIFDVKSERWADCMGDGFMLPFELVVQVAEIVCSVIAEVALSALVIEKSPIR